MARVRLPVWQQGSVFEYTDPAPPWGTVTVPHLRVLVTLLLGPDHGPAVPDTRMDVSGILDTGAPVGVIDGGTWETFDRLGLIEFLTPTAPLPPLTIGGAAGVPYRVGRIRVGG